MKLFSTFLLLMALGCSNESPPIEQPRKDNSKEKGDEDSKAKGDGETSPDGKKKTDHHTIYLLLHGLNSDLQTWNEVVEASFDGKCPELMAVSADKDLKESKCYRYNFIARTDDNGHTWESGDGASYEELGQEVGAVVESIKVNFKATSIVMVGHSRGGLAARSYLQSDKVDKSIRYGLLTIGTPHSGSPFGRIKHWLDEDNTSRDDLAPVLSPAAFIFSPSTGHLAQSFDNNKPIRDKYSESTWALNDGLANLNKSVSQYGEIYATEVGLGKSGSADFLDTDSLIKYVFPGSSFNAMVDFVVGDIPKDWRDGDGIVPALSAQIEKIPDAPKLKIPMLSKEVKDVAHTRTYQFDGGLRPADTNDGLTGVTAEIEAMLTEMTKHNDFAEFSKTPKATEPTTDGDL